MEISVTQIKDLREKTSAGVIECKNALLEAEGNIDKACQILQERGLATAEKKKGRETSQGMIDAYIHAGGRIGAMVELNCETDFVAKTKEFRDLAHNLALQIAASSPQFLAPEDAQGENCPALEEVCLLEQPFIKDESKKIKDLVTEVAAKMGENVKIKRFARFELGD